MATTKTPLSEIISVSDLAWQQRQAGVRMKAIWQHPETNPQPNGCVHSVHYDREAMARGAELGMRPLVAHCHLGLGKLYRRVGKRQEAQEHLATATTMYREMEMQFWLEQAEAEMRDLVR